MRGGGCIVCVGGGPKSGCGLVCDL